MHCEIGSDEKRKSQNKLRCGKDYIWFWVGFLRVNSFLYSPARLFWWSISWLTCLFLQADSPNMPASTILANPMAYCSSEHIFLMATLTKQPLCEWVPLSLSLKPSQNQVASVFPYIIWLVPIFRICNYGINKSPGCCCSDHVDDSIHKEYVG